jgi:hypothetical protein
MEASLKAVLNEAEYLMVSETEPAELAELGEDEAIALEGRVRRARAKAVTQYRRSASTRVTERGGRGKARPENSRARARAEAFERALSRVSRRVAVLAQESAAALRAERLAVARAAKQADWPGAGQAVPRQARRGPAVTPEPTGERALRSPVRERRRAQDLAGTARWQTRRDRKG